MKEVTFPQQNNLPGTLGLYRYRVLIEMVSDFVSDEVIFNIQIIPAGLVILYMEIYSHGGTEQQRAAGSQNGRGSKGKKDEIALIIGGGIY